VILAALVLFTAAGVGLGLVLNLAHVLNPQTLGRLKDPRQTAPYFATVAVTFGLLLFGFWAASRLVQGKRFGDLVGRWRWRFMALGFGVWLGVLVFGALADVLLRPRGFSVSADAATPLFVLWATPALAIQTFAEEFVFRGVITQGLVRAFRRPWIACLVSGLLFGSAHIPNGPIQAANAAVFGVVLAALAIETGGLALGWGLHLANNLFGGIVIISTGDVFNGAHGLFRQDTPGLNGFDFVFGVAALLLAAWFLLRRTAGVRAETGG
jgi:membrane protease YdiL (CAAX protease family)